MSDTSLIFNLLAIDKISNVLGGVNSNFSKFALGIGIAAADAGVHAVKMAGDFQVGLTRLVTGAGEAQSNMKTVSAGILDLAGQVGESTHDLAAGMYLIESAGYHGAAGLDVLKYAAQGAQVGNADMATVADAVTTALNAYHMGANQAAQATNALIATEGQGKTTLEALSASLSTVAPIAAAAHVRLNEVLAAMATMTAQGTDAASAATYLKQTIGQLSNPTGKAAQEMKSLGLNAVDVSMNLGKNGLASTLTMLTDAIERKMGPAGTVLIEHLQKAAKNTTAFQQVLANLPPAQQTYVGALANMVGGTKSMQAALELTGANMKVFTDNIAVIDEKVKTGGNTIEGWSLVQKNFNQRMAETKGTLEALSIRIGNALLPAAQQVLNVVMASVTWFGKHRDVARDLAIVIGLVTAALVIHKTVTMAQTAYLRIAEVATKAWAAAQWILNVAMDANPVGLIILAIIALVAALWTHSKAFRDFFIGLWHDIWGVLKDVGAWFAGPFAGFFVDTWDHIWGFFKAVGAWFAGPFAGFFVSAGRAVAAPFLWLWHNILDPFWHGFEDALGLVNRIVRSFIALWLDFATWFWTVVYKAYIKPAIDGIGAAFMWVGANVFVPVTHAIIVTLSAIGAAAMWLWRNAILPAVHGIADAAVWVWQNVLVPVGAGIAQVWDWISQGAMWLWHNALEPAFHGIAAAGEWVWHMLVTAFDAVMDKVHTVGRVFSEVFSAIGGFIASAFHDAVGIVRGAINSVIGLINSAIGFINGDMIDKVNKLPGVNFPHLPRVPYLAAGGDILRGGLFKVGERGTETVALPPGSRVYPHGADDTTPAVVEMHAAPGDQVAETLLRLLRPVIRGKYGGDVTRALSGAA